MPFNQREIPYTGSITRLHDLAPERYPFILSSTVKGEHTHNARYDIVMAFPGQRLQLGEDLQLTGHTEYGGQGDDFLDGFNRWFEAESTDTSENVRSGLPFTGGWFIYCGYELAQQIEPCLTLPLPAGQPVAMAVRIPAAVILDHSNSRCILISESADDAQLDQMQQDIESLPPLAARPVTIACSEIDESDETHYLEQVERIKQYIVDGDIFQANLSRRWQITIDEDISNTDIFEALAHSNPSSFACMLDIGEHSGDSCIISSSPERLVEVRGRRIQTRPIAGTRPRSDDKGTDDSLSEELLAHPKEQAEHIMLIDLERNDLGRICKPGSIHVDELLTLETWQHVHHIVSNIHGELREDVLPGDVIRAVFPGGTITGCPKVRCMEILAEQEQEARGCYTASTGYINRDGSMDMNILIRTLYREGGQITLRAGGGIVTDSDPRAELAETRAKAKGLMQAFELN